MMANTIIILLTLLNIGLLCQCLSLDAISNVLASHRRLFRKDSALISSVTNSVQYRLSKRSSVAVEQCILQHPPTFPGSSGPDNPDGTVQGGLDGLINVSNSSCGPSGATRNISATSGPNGNIDWLNCGLADGEWRPPVVKIADIVTVDLTSALKDPGSPFHACKDYISLFEKYGSQFQCHKSQQSSCNPSTIGGAGEQGMMQITSEKCTGAPDGNCLDPDFNIRTGSKYFADTLAGNDGDLLLTIGQYNGWYSGLTVGSATAAASTSCCFCQNNLDYLHQFLNGWCQNINAYSHNPPLGKYFNLKDCH